MSGRPQRDDPKSSIQVYVDSDVLLLVLLLYKSEKYEFSSLSQLLETIIFLSEHMFIEEPDDRFILRIVDVMSSRIKTKIRGLDVERQYVHATLDKQALAFIDMLRTRYDMVFRNRSDVVNLLLCNIAAECSTPEGVAYYANRLYDVLRIHPLKRE